MTGWPNVLPPTANGIETVWSASTAVGTTVAAIGAGITTTNLRAARRAYRRALLGGATNQLHVAITEQAVRNESIAVAALVLLLVMLALFVIVGVVAMWTPEPLRPEVQVTDVLAAGVLVAGVVIASIAVILLTVGSILNRRDRHRLTNRITGRLLTEEMARRLAARARRPSGDSPEQSP
jgi:uncharacterized membrane protein (DUF485 family)